ncbi:MAG: hypothetical protein DRJ29_13765 [Bacteroidetes bacterium]|nr:MAG: hypothetical protein DRJ29_13765 [Bacteroidota bacterium]
MRKRIYILAVLTVILILAVGSCRKAGTWLVKADNPPHADVMVMLTGSISDRVLQTADLYNEGVATRLWIVEEGMGASRALEARGVKLISNTTQVKSAMITLGIPADSIRIVPGDAASTRMEAEIVRSYLHSQTGIDTLLLVTSAAHTRRAFKIFKAAFSPLDEPPVVCCSPSTYTDFHPEKWWRSKEDIQEVVNEYMKLTNFVFFERRELRND